MAEKNGLYHGSLTLITAKSQIAKLCAIRGVACMVEDSVKRIRAKEPYEGNLHVPVGGAPGNRCFYPDADKPKMFKVNCRSKN